MQDSKIKNSWSYVKPHNRCKLLYEPYIKEQEQQEVKDLLSYILLPTKLPSTKYLHHSFISRTFNKFRKKLKDSRFFSGEKDGYEVVKSLQRIKRISKTTTWVQAVNGTA